MKFLKKHYINYLVLLFVFIFGLTSFDFNTQKSFIFFILFCVAVFVALSIDLYLTGGKKENYPSWRNLFNFILKNRLDKYQINVYKIDAPKILEDLENKKNFWNYFPLFLFTITLLLGITGFVLNKVEKEGYILLVLYAIFMIEVVPTVIWPFIFKDKKSKIAACINASLYLSIGILFSIILIVFYFSS